MQCSTTALKPPELPVPECGTLPSARARTQRKEVGGQRARIQLREGGLRAGALPPARRTRRRARAPSAPAAPSPPAPHRTAPAAPAGRHGAGSATVRFPGSSSQGGCALAVQCCEAGKKRDNKVLHALNSLCSCYGALMLSAAGTLLPSAAMKAGFPHVHMPHQETARPDHTPLFLCRPVSPGALARGRPPRRRRRRRRRAAP